MIIHLPRRALLLICLTALVLAGLVPGAVSRAALHQPAAISYWGMNLYLTKRERLQTGDNLGALASSAQAAGVRWTREELPWDLIEPSNGRFEPVYDAPLRQTAERGFGIIGMLLTTPGWARDRACTGNYWCPPTSAQEYAQFAAWMVERYDGDGVADAPGSPRVAAWQLWNEPNTTGTWASIGDENARRRRYGELMGAAYPAIKAADPTALVLTGGVYVYDGSYCAPTNCDGLVFLSGVFAQVLAARHAFDVLAIHPYIPTERPDAPNIPRLITVEGRVRHARAWLNANGRGNAPLWISEIGWCTSGGVCPGGVAVSEEQQANYLVRSLVIAQQNGVQHASWFQFEDAFNDPGREWSNAAIVRNYDGAGYPVKPAYLAYRTLAGHLGDAVPQGPGPAHTHVYDPSQPYVGSGGTYDYRYLRGTTTIDVLWRPTDSIELAFPVAAGRAVTLVQRDSTRTPLTPSGGVVRVTLSERPILIVQGEAAPRLAVAPAALTMLAQPGATTGGDLVVTNSGAGIISWSTSTATPWLALSSSGGVAPGYLRATANTQGLAAGTYTGAITITGTDGAGSTTIPVRLIVSSTLRRTYLPLTPR